MEAVFAELFICPLPPRDGGGSASSKNNDDALILGRIKKLRHRLSAQDIYWARQVENANILIIASVGGSANATSPASASIDLGPALANLSSSSSAAAASTSSSSSSLPSSGSTAPRILPIDFPSPPQAVLSSPTVEVIIMYFSSDPSSSSEEQQQQQQPVSEGVETAMSQFLAAGNAKAHGVLGSVSGWMRGELDEHPAGPPGHGQGQGRDQDRAAADGGGRERALVNLIGWSSVADHVAFRGMEDFKQSIGIFRGAGHKRSEMFHFCPDRR